MILTSDRYDEIKKATQEKVLVDRPIRDIAKEFGISQGYVSKIKHSRSYLDFRAKALKQNLKRYGFTEENIDNLINKEIEAGNAVV